MFLLYDIFHLSPVLMFTGISFGAFLWLSFLMIRAFRRHKLGLEVLLSAFAFGSLAYYGLDWMRRDYILLLCLFFIFASRNRMKFRTWIIIANLVGIFIILLHEAMCFTMLPALFVITWLHTGKFWKSVAVWIPVIVVVVLCGVFKGSSDDAMKIILDYDKQKFPGIFHFYPEHLPMLLEYLNIDTLDVCRTTLTDNVYGIGPDGIPNIWAFMTMIFYVGVMALLMPFAFARGEVRGESVRFMAIILIFQLIMQIPMITLFSVDNSRDMIKWVLSSYMIYMYMSKSESDKLLGLRGLRFIPAFPQRWTAGLQSCPSGWC